ncbi:MAG: methylated-DNA--[protein]-cysteine S-methyltransferase [Actinomycetes bacterium]
MAFHWGDPLADRSLGARLAAYRTYQPRATPPAGLIADVAYQVHDTVVGPLVLAVGERGVLACSYQPEQAVTARLAEVVSAVVVRDPRRTDPLRRQIDQYLAGRRRRFDIEVDLRLASPFAHEVLDVLTSVPYGTTISYTQLAARIGRSGASRAVGTVLGTNPVCIVLPCHRVLRAGGGLGGYAGGIEAKIHLLTLEGIPTDQPRP